MYMAVLQYYFTHKFSPSYNIVHDIVAVFDIDMICIIVAMYIVIILYSILYIIIYYNYVSHNYV